MKDFERIDQLEKDIRFLEEMLGRRLGSQIDNTKALIELANRILNIEEQQLKDDHA